jgi:hypothetical protein
MGRRRQKQKIWAAGRDRICGPLETEDASGWIQKMWAAGDRRYAPLVTKAKDMGY